MGDISIFPVWSEMCWASRYSGGSTSTLLLLHLDSYGATFNAQSSYRRSSSGGYNGRSAGSQLMADLKWDLQSSAILQGIRTLICKKISVSQESVGA